MGTGRPSKCYRRIQQPFTRKAYVKRSPELPSGLKFTQGNTAKFDFPAKISLIALIDGQISAKAIDSMRVTVNRELKVLGEQNYRLQINSYPHHIVRMHGLLGVAKAERISKGMKQSFGHNQYRMAQIHKGHALIVISINDDAVSFGVCKKALRKTIPKIPLKWEMIHEGIKIENVRACPALPKRTREKKSTGGRTAEPREIPQSPQVGK